MRVQQLLLLSFLLWGPWGAAQQSLQPNRLVDQAREKGLPFNRADLFSLAPATRSKPTLLEGNLRTYDILQVNRGTLAELLESQPGAIEVPLPTTQRNGLQANLVKVEVTSSDFAVYQSSGPGPVEAGPGIHYRGTLDGEAGSVVALSVFEGELMGIISSPALGNLVLGKLQGDEWNGQHILYNDAELAHLQEFYCDTEDSGRGYRAEELEPNATLRGPGDCVRIYLEVDYDIYQNKGGTTGAVNYVTGIFNEAATLYANENINVTISEMLVWDHASPYSGSSSSAMLNEFQSYRTSFNGDLAQLVSYKTSGGIAVVNGLCRSNPALQMSFASIGSSYNTVPDYSFTVMVMTHELGHLMGSQHTHACVWNGNNTAIDGCAGFTEGGCPTPGIPSGGGTIMSYCHLTSAGINFSLGFGNQPGNVIRNGVANAYCLTACSDGGGGGGGGGGDGGGGGGTDCTENLLTLEIILDNYGSETSWQLRDDAGAVMKSGGPYSNGQSGQTISDDICVPDGCYTFVINDAYGDGICCGYGNGSYTLTDGGGNVLASGGSFNASESTDFCTGSNPPPPPPDSNPDCDGREYYLALTLDEYGRETTWSLRNASGTTLYSDGPFNNKLDGTTLRDTFCLADGCYTFEILDSFGDGICCGYGNGSYTLTGDQGNTIASGGNFGGGGGGNDGSSCVSIDLTDYTIDSYGGTQDKGDYELLTNGTVLKIDGNAWKSIALDYDITANTVLEFDFRSTLQGEIHGIGFDDNDRITAQLTFSVYGTQNWGITNFHNYPGDGNWKSYSIPVGDFYTGPANRLFFAADHDSNPSDGNSFFRNIRIHEGGGCGTNLVDPESETTVLQIREIPSEALDVFPNPTSDQLTLRFKGKTEHVAEVQVFNVMGQLVRRQAVNVSEGPNVSVVPVRDLPEGSYFLRLQSGDLQREAKFIVYRR
jgi:hypothetical protein